MSGWDEKVHELYGQLGDHRYKKIVSREELVLLAAALSDRLDEVQRRYNGLHEAYVNAISAAE